MKACFVYLPHPHLGEPDAQAPLGILYLAAILEEAGIEVEVANLSSFGDDQEAAINALPEADLFGITLTSLELPQANRFAKALKEVQPNSKVCIGGPGTSSPEFADRTVIDTIVFGEGENIIVQICRDVENGELKPSYNGTVVDINTIPFPARHLLDTIQGGTIFAGGRQYYEGDSTVFVTSRGCPFKCTFCAAPALTPKMRYRDPISCRDEVRLVKNEFGIRQFRLSDDMFMAKPSQVKAICEVFGPEDIAWRISTRVRPFDEDSCQRMFDAGCKEVSFGVESFDDVVLKHLKKKTTAEDNVRAIEIANRVGMGVRVLFMIGTPGQRRETVDINIDYLNRVQFDTIACTTFMPIPGTDTWNRPEANGIRILKKDLDLFNFYFFGPTGENPLVDVVELIGRDREEVKQEILRFRAYLRDRKLANRDPSTHGWPAVCP